MNEQVCTSYGCVQQDVYTPKDVANITYGPIEDLESFWNSLDGMGKGVLVSSVVLLSVFIGTMLLK